MSMLFHLKYIQSYKIFSKGLIITIYNSNNSNQQKNHHLNGLEVVLHILKNIQICIYIYHSVRKNY